MDRPGLSEIIEEHKITIPVGVRPHVVTAPSADESMWSGKLGGNRALPYKLAVSFKGKSVESERFSRFIVLGRFERPTSKQVS